MGSVEELTKTFHLFWFLQVHHRFCVCRVYFVPSHGQDYGQKRLRYSKKGAFKRAYDVFFSFQISKNSLVYQKYGFLWRSIKCIRLDRHLVNGVASGTVALN